MYPTKNECETRKEFLLKQQSVLITEHSKLTKRIEDNEKELSILNDILDLRKALDMPTVSAKESNGVKICWGDSDE